MRKLVVTEFMSLDGVIENPMWTFKYWNDETAKFKGDESLAGDALLLGRVTYEGFAAAWPNSKDEGAEYFNSVRKYVLSTTLDKAEWNNSVLLRDIEDVRKLKEEDGKDIIVHGSGAMIQSLMQHDLVDSYRILMYPVVLGKGQKLFADGTTANLKLVQAQPFSTGVVALIYEPARK